MTGFSHVLRQINLTDKPDKHWIQISTSHAKSKQRIVSLKCQSRLGPLQCRIQEKFSASNFGHKTSTGCMSGIVWGSCGLITLFQRKMICKKYELWFWKRWQFLRKINFWQKKSSCESRESCETRDYSFCEKMLWKVRSKCVKSPEYIFCLSFPRAT